MRRSIGNDRIKEKREHIQDVYDALYSLETIINIGKKARVKDIWWWLDEHTQQENKNIKLDKNKKETITIRTIERCLKDDPRIVKDGWYYHIDYEARLESRYLRPEWFGHDMFFAVMGGFRPESPEKSMSELIRRFGALIIFNFIEAVRPFKDKSMNLRERSELIDHWAKKALDLQTMFSIFMMTLGRRENDTFDRTKPISEIKESRIKEMLETFEKSCPDLYQNLIQARRGQPQILDEMTRKTTGEIGFVHGKTYHSGWTDWWSYLKETNPSQYKDEMERLQREYNKRKWGMS